MLRLAILKGALLLKKVGNKTEEYIEEAEP